MPLYQHLLNNDAVDRALKIIEDQEEQQKEADQLIKECLINKFDEIDNNFELNSKRDEIINKEAVLSESPSF
jgi:hypothetical protein